MARIAKISKDLWKEVDIQYIDGFILLTHLIQDLLQTGFGVSHLVFENIYSVHFFFFGYIFLAIN